ncbi:MAG: sigma-70 family RNA polymerase sigma factor [Planctomycetota bacterium]|nr:sigma-70 family RNA polymerase sigma factor [Planctomycetota bacterium]
MTTESNDENHHQWVMETLQHYERKLLRYAKRLLGGDEDGAQDIVQHAFLKLCQQDRNEIGGRVAPWLYLVCRNKVLDQMRKQKRMESTGEERERAIVGRETDPGQSAEKQDLASQLQKIVGQLPDNQREVIDLWSHGLQYSEIASVIKKNESTVRVQVHRAIQKLKKNPAISRWLDASRSGATIIPATSSSH